MKNRGNADAKGLMDIDIVQFLTQIHAYTRKFCSHLVGADYTYNYV